MLPASPVVSAINPLFQPAAVPRQPSSLVQKTLSNITQQLAALEDSMQLDNPGATTSSGTVSLK